MREEKHETIERIYNVAVESKDTIEVVPKQLAQVGLWRRGGGGGG